MQLLDYEVGSRSNASNEGTARARTDMCRELFHLKINGIKRTYDFFLLNFFISPVSNNDLGRQAN